MRSIPRRWKALLGGALACACVDSVRGQTAGPSAGQSAYSGGVSIRPGGTGLSRTDLNASADADVGGAGTVESSIIRDATAAQETFFRTFQNGLIRIPKLGYGQGQLSVAAPLGASAGFSPFAFGTRPEEAELKFGNFYLDIISLGGSFLWTDNSLLSETGQQAEPTAVVRLQSALIYQINPAMQLTAAGTAVWLPLTGEVSFSDPVADYTATFAPVFQTQFSYDIPLNKVDVQVLESFSAQSGGLGESGRAFDVLDRALAGRDANTFRDTQAQGPTDRRSATALAYRNTIGVNVSSVLPTVTRLTFGYLHENIWQSSGQGQASSSDSFTADLRSERENMRFKPFFNYGARHQSDNFGYDSTPRGGIEGPISPYFDLRAEMGYFLAGDEAGEGYTWLVSLTHRPRESIQQQLDYGRSVTYPDRSLGTLVGYTARLQASQDILIEVAAQELAEGQVVRLVPSRLKVFEREAAVAGAAR